MPYRRSAIARAFTLFSTRTGRANSRRSVAPIGTCLHPISSASTTPVSCRSTLPGTHTPIPSSGSGDPPAMKRRRSAVKSPRKVDAKASKGSLAERRTVPSMPTSTKATWSATTFTPIALPAEETSPSSRAGRPPWDGEWSSSWSSPSAIRSFVSAVIRAGETFSARARSARDAGPCAPRCARTADRLTSVRDACRLAIVLLFIYY